MLDIPSWLHRMFFSEAQGQTSRVLARVSSQHTLAPCVTGENWCSKLESTPCPPPKRKGLGFSEKITESTLFPTPASSLPSLVCNELYNRRTQEGRDKLSFYISSEKSSPKFSQWFTLPTPTLGGVLSS